MFPYQRPAAGGSQTSAKFSYGDRVNHADSLQQQLAEATAGMTEFARITVNSNGGKDFRMESLDNSGMKVLAVRQHSDNEQEAIVLLSDLKTKEKLNSKISDFRNNNSSNGKPKNEKFIGRIQSITPTDVSSLFEGGVEELIARQPQWVEIWLTRKEKKREQHIDVEKCQFFHYCEQLHLPVNSTPLEFPERLIFAIYADKTDVLKLAALDKRFQRCLPLRPLTSYVTGLEPRKQSFWTQNVCARTEIPSETSPVVCVLDSGCNRHPILEPLLQKRAVFSIKEGMSAADSNGHGTSMAGVSAYGDLNKALLKTTNTLYPHQIESCNLHGVGDTNMLYGENTLAAAYKAESLRPDVPRLFCMALTSCFQTGVLGAPSSWSAALDACTSMVDDDEGQGRLFVVSAGNREEFSQNQEDTLESTVQDPAQAWNVMTVGAVTHLTDYDPGRGYRQDMPYAQDGGLSPYSTNSLNWDKKAPIKPDFLCEGGNRAYSPSLGTYDNHDNLCLISPHYGIAQASYTPFWGTSLATALASNMAATIMRKYPTIRPETVRALMVHSAEWTTDMTDKFLENKKCEGYLRLARICGHGEASLNRALECVDNGLTLVHEGCLSPYKKAHNSVIYNEMAYHELPWPTEALRELGDASVELKVTLSYFIEPSPSAVQGLEGRYAYPSCRLRFSVRPATDSKDDHIQKVSKAMRTEEERVSFRNRYQGWQLGDNAFLGSVHSDIWEGSAMDLSQMGGIIVYPESGWWKLRSSLNRYDRKIHYTLVVSIRTKERDIDIYTPVKTLIEQTISAPNEIPVNIQST